MPNTPVTRQEFEAAIRRTKMDRRVISIAQVVIAIAVCLGLYMGFRAFMKSEEYEQTRIRQLEVVARRLDSSTNRIMSSEKDLSEQRDFFFKERIALQQAIKEFSTIYPTIQKETDENIEKVRNHTNTERSLYFDNLTRDHFDK